jgi:hypothetical protein
VVCWLMLIYRVPSEPSRLRTAVWRRLKALGAVYVANSVAVLPESPEAGRALRGCGPRWSRWAGRRIWSGLSR